jgi:NTP pyrophosphatase (non-canonical NTP hydrolase)
MSKYSFLVAAREPEYFAVNDSLRLIKHNGWLVGESIEHEEISKAQSASTLKAVQLARKIAKIKKIPLEDAFALLQEGKVAAEDLAEEFADEILALLSESKSADTSSARLVTAFIRSRGQGYIAGEWKPLEDWAIEDTKELSRPLVRKILTFVNDEQDKEGESSEKKD